jgi:hypothetical protein
MPECWNRWRIFTSLQALAEPGGGADGAIGGIKEFCMLFSGQVLEFECVVQVILCC